MPTVYVVQSELYTRPGEWTDSAVFDDVDEARANLAELRATIGSAVGPMRLVRRVEEVLD